MDEKKIVDYIMAQQKISVPDLQSAFSLDYKSARKIIEDLTEDGEIKACDKLYYTPVKKEDSVVYEKRKTTDNRPIGGDNKTSTIRNYTFTADTEKSRELNNEAKRVLWYVIMKKSATYYEIASYYNLGVLNVRFIVLQLKSKNYVTTDETVNPLLSVTDFCTIFGDVIDENGTPFTGDAKADLNEATSPAIGVLIRRRLAERRKKEGGINVSDANKPKRRIKKPDPDEEVEPKITDLGEKERKFFLKKGFGEEDITRIFAADRLGEGLLRAFALKNLQATKSELKSIVMSVIHDYPFGEETILYKYLFSAHSILLCMTEEQFENYKRNLR